jgi:hypothetical protein
VRTQRRTMSRAPLPAVLATLPCYSLAFASKVLLDKWLDHTPLERQIRILDRHGLVVSLITL